MVSPDLLSQWHITLCGKRGLEHHWGVESFSDPVGVQCEPSGLFYSTQWEFTGSPVMSVSRTRHTNYDTGRKKYAPNRPICGRISNARTGEPEDLPYTMYHSGPLFNEESILLIDFVRKLKR